MNGSVVRCMLVITISTVIALAAMPTAAANDGSVPQNCTVFLISDGELIWLVDRDAART